MKQLGFVKSKTIGNSFLIYIASPTIMKCVNAPQKFSSRFHSKAAIMLIYADSSVDLIQNVAKFTYILVLIQCYYAESRYCASFNNIWTWLR